MTALEIAELIASGLKVASPAIGELWALLMRALGGEKVDPAEVKAALVNARNGFDQALHTLDAKHAMRVDELRDALK